jgi:hypothetical protein
MRSTGKHKTDTQKPYNKQRKSVGSNVDESNMWKASMFISAPLTNTAHAQVPTLTEMELDSTNIKARTNDKKTTLFSKEFFLEPPAHLQVDENDHDYPAPLFDFRPILDKRIEITIKKLHPYKASDTDSFSNSILTHCADALLPRIGPLFWMVNALKYWPRKWAYLGTIVLWKPRKSDYTKMNSHRPISLIKKLAMLYSKCLSEDLLQQVEMHNMLAPTQFGFRPGRTMTDTMHYLVTKTKNTWRKGKSVALPMLNIKAAFPHIIISRLVHAMCQKGVPREYTDWVTMQFKNRKMQLQFDD